jgi:hypothetical protein
VAFSGSPPSTMAYHLRFGMAPPEPSGRTYGSGPDWEGRAIAAMLRRCYRRGLRHPVLEEVAVVAISILPSGGLAGCDDEHVLGLEAPSSGGERASVDA